MISTRNLSPLPDVDRLRRLLQSMAMLDAILCPEWELRYYSFNAHWSDTEKMGSMRNGQGDDFFALFNAAGCFLKGFAHEAMMSPYGAFGPKQVWTGVLDSVPADFAECLSEPAFSIEDTTFCVWRRYADSSWQRGGIAFPSGPDPDGSEDLLSPLDGIAKTYQTWAEAYYETAVDLTAVAQIYENRLLTQELVARLNADVSIKDLKADIEEIGYPVAP